MISRFVLIHQLEKWQFFLRFNISNSLKYPLKVYLSATLAIMPFRDTGLRSLAAQLTVLPRITLHNVPNSGCISDGNLRCMP